MPSPYTHTIFSMAGILYRPVWKAETIFLVAHLQAVTANQYEETLNRRQIKGKNFQSFHIVKTSQSDWIL